MAAPLRVLCIGNGGVVVRNENYFTDRTTADFLHELGTYLGQVRFCAWRDVIDDPICQSKIGQSPNVSAIALPTIRGRITTKLVNGFRSFCLLLREVLRSDVSYIFWPGRVSSVTTALCHALRRPYGIYFRGEELSSAGALARALKRAAFVIATGDGLMRIAKMHSHNVETVTPMMMLRRHHVQKPNISVRGGAFRLLFVGRIEARKGIRELLHALAALNKAGVSCRATLVGHCHEPDILNGAVALGVADQLDLRGVISDFDQLSNEYRRADAFILPSHDEGFPRVLYEAMAFGVPIITTFVGSIPGLMIDEQNCLRINVKDPADLASKIKRLRDNPGLGEKLALVAHDLITQLTTSWSRTHAMQVAEQVCKLKS